MVGTPSFIFGGSTGETPESIARKRKIANALLASNTMPQNVGQGIAAIGDALAGRYMTSKLDAQDKAGQAEVGSILEAPAFPSSVAAGGSPTAPAALGADASAIRSGLVERGIPEHIADGFIMNFKDESGLNPGINEKNPTVPGSRGGYGLYQLTGPRRDAYEAFAANRGVSPSDTNAQLDFLVSELKGPEANAAKSIFAAPDAGTAAAAIAKDFLRPNAKSLAERVARYTSGGAPVQTASLDPSAGMADFGDHGPVTELSPQERAKRLAANQAGAANITDAGVPRVSPEIMAALQPPTRVGSTIQVPPVEEVNGPAPVGVGGVPAGSGGQPVLDFTQVPQLSAAAGVPFAGSGAPTVAAALAQPQTAPQPKSSVSDALLRKNDLALGGIMAPAGTPQPAGAKLGGAFPVAPSADRAPITGGNSGYFPPAPQQDDEASRMLKVINHPYATEAQKAYAQRRLAVLEKQNDPSTQLDLEVKKAQLAALNKKDTTAEYKEVNKRLYRIDKNTNQVTDVTPEAPGGAAGGKFRFDGQSVEGQALNGLMDSGVLTEQQAQEIAAGKTITDPSTGAITFLTPTGIMTQMPGQAPQPVAGGAATPAPAAPNGAAPAKPGLIPLTGGKEQKLTEGERKNQSLYSVIKPELKVVEDNFDALADPKNQAYAKLPISEYGTTPEYQKAANSLQTIISSYLYSVSGATATPDEVRKQTDILMPRPLESKESIANKKRRIRTMVNAVAKSGGLPGEENDLPDGVTEDDITETMRANNMTREQVLEKLNGGS